MNPRQSSSDTPRRSQSNSRFSFYLLLAIIGVIALLTFKVMKAFILPLFLAVLLVVIFKPVHLWICNRCKGRNNLAAGLTTAAILVTVLGPVAWALMMGVVEGVRLAHGDWGALVDDLSQVTKKVGLDIPPVLADKLNDIESELQSLRPVDDRSQVEEDLTKKATLAATLVTEINTLESILKKTVETGKAPDATPESQRWGNRADKVIDETQPEQPLTELTLDAQSLAKLTAGFRDHTPSVDEVNQYEGLVERAEVNYRLTRTQLFGGIIWAPITEYANPTKAQVNQIQQYAVNELRGFIIRATGKTTSVMGSMIVQLCILTLATFYFLVDGPEMVAAAMRLSPMDDEYEQEMITEFAKLSRAVVLATLLSAISQGILAGIAYWLLGFSSFFVLIVLTTILALVPFVGAAAVWVPCCIYLAFPHLDPVTGVEMPPRMLAAVLLAIYGTCVISMADNVIKPWLLNGQSNLHPLFALLSVLGGVQALGAIGVLVGPMLLAFLQTLLKLLNRDLARSDG